MGRHRGGRNGWSSSKSYIYQDILKRRIESDGFKCKWCGREDLVETPPGAFGVSMVEPGNGLTLDHLKDMAAGGEDTYENCVIACRKCNGYRSEISNTRMLHPGWTEEEIIAYISPEAKAARKEAKRLQWEKNNEILKEINREQSPGSCAVSPASGEA